MGLAVGLAELMLFVIFGAVCAALVLTIILAIFSAILITIGISFDSEVDEETLTGTIAIWGVMLIIGVICRATNNSWLWNVSPFGNFQEIIENRIYQYLLPAANNRVNDDSGMWANLWSYCIVSLLISVLIIFLNRVFKSVKKSALFAPNLSSSPLVGKWKGPNSHIFEFAADGKFIEQLANGTCSVSWRPLDGDKIRLGEESYARICVYVLDNDVLFLKGSDYDGTYLKMKQ